MNSRLTFWDDACEKNVEPQASFSSGHITTDNVFTQQSVIQRFFDSVIEQNCGICTTESGCFIQNVSRLFILKSPHV